MNWKLLIKVLLTGLAVYLVSTRIDFPALGVWIAAVPVPLILASFLLFNLSKIVGALRLNLFFRAENIQLTTLQNLLLYYKGMFYNLFLPGGIGGDGYKIYLISNTLGNSWRYVFKAVMWDRVSGAVAILFLSAVLMLLVPVTYAYSFVLWPTVATAILVFPVFYIITRWISPSYGAITISGNLLAILIQLLQAAVALIIFRGLDIAPAQMGEYMVVFFISSLASILPITVGGVGIRELVFLTAARYTAIEPNKAVAFSLIFFALNAVSALAGAFVTVNLQKPQPKSEVVS